MASSLNIKWITLVLHTMMISTTHLLTTQYRVKPICDKVVCLFCIFIVKMCYLSSVIVRCYSFNVLNRIYFTKVLQ